MKLLSLAKRKEQARAVLDRLNEVNPDPRCELTYHTPYQLLVSVVLSAQTTDKSVNKVMEPLYTPAFTPAYVVKLGSDALLAKIRTIGLAPTKAKNVVRLSQLLIEKHGGEVPSTREELEALPGVGRKTANVILGEIFREPTLAVDTHVYRVSRRLGLQNETTPEKAELELLKVVDPSSLPGGHHHFILHGRYVCKAMRPDCDVCVLKDICPSYEELRPRPKEEAVKAKSTELRKSKKRESLKPATVSEIVAKSTKGPGRAKSKSKARSVSKAR